MNPRSDNERRRADPPGPAARPEYDAWLARPSTIRLLWRVFIVLLVLVVVAQLVFPIKGKFGVDGWLGFGAVFGFLCCLGMVLVANALGFVVKRDQNYYRRGDD